MIQLDETSAIRAKVNAMTGILKLSKRFNIKESVNNNTKIMLLHDITHNYERYIKRKVALLSLGVGSVSTMVISHIFTRKANL